MDKEVGISLELLQKVVDYLQEQPYHQVYQLIARLMEEVKNDEK